MNSRAMKWVYRTVPLLSSLIVAVASFALSFVALRDVAADTGAVPQNMAWLVPIVIDGGVMCASAVIWASAAMHRRRQVFPFVVVFVLVALSVVVNAAHAGPSLLAKTIAALPPLVLLATLELVAITTRSAAQPVPAAAPVPPSATPARPQVQGRSTATTTHVSVASGPAPTAEVSPTDVDARLSALEAELEGPISGHLDLPTTASEASSGRSQRRQTRVRALDPE